jgi:sialate O-acetylesterase
MKFSLMILYFGFFPNLNPVFSQVKLPQLIKDSMVLQREANVKIWGWASPKEKIELSFLKKKYRTSADAKGNWMITFSPMKAGGPYTMKIVAKNHITLNNVLIGDVWLCSGQSNMFYQMKRFEDKYAQEISESNYPMIRQFWIPTTTDLLKPRTDLPEGYWKSANSQDVRQFSAVAYFFAKTLYEKYHVPIGIINSSVPGTPIEAWTSEEGLRDFASVKDIIDSNKDTTYVNKTNRIADEINTRNRSKPEEDKGITSEIKWYDTSFAPKDWHRISIPGYWNDQGIKNLNGVVWYRREIEVPESMTGIPSTILMGKIVDADFIYINGVLVGNTGYKYPDRKYNISAGILKPGKNLIVIRVINDAGKGGFVPDKPYYIFAGKDTINLSGYWQYKIGKVFIPHTPMPGIVVIYQPMALYNAMISPLTNYSIKGILWYQGESNTGNPDNYDMLQSAMIADWRSKWKQGDIPFLFVQLPGYMDYNYLPSESQWAAFREAQAKSLSHPKTGMVVTIDLGEWNDIHPQNKKDVGIRAALAAENVAYGDENIVYSGPIYKSLQIIPETTSSEYGKVIITFSNVGSGLTSNDNEALRYFSIASTDKKFVWAKAKIFGNKVILWNENVQHPLYVRYAWADNPRGANLYNKEGLPASPFRTDK